MALMDLKRPKAVKFMIIGVSLVCFDAADITVRQFGRFTISRQENISLMSAIEVELPSISHGLKIKPNPFG
ncbi:hypothetical protein BCU12_05850 [Vibrio sp. 10N.261.55.A7]|nr:hypothetical protein BCU12_05850 [Vibrio sp. 10N.261.55.A7]